MSLAMPVQSGRLSIVSHAHSSQFMDDLTSLRNPVRGLLLRIVLPWIPPCAANHCPSSGFDDGAKRLLHIRGHLRFVLAPFPMKAQHRNPPLVLNVGVWLAVTLVVGNHLAPSVESDDRTVRAAAFLLQADPIAFMLFAHAVEAAYCRHVASPSKLDMIAAQKVVFLPEPPPGHVQVHAAHAVMVVYRHLLQSRKVSGQIAAD